jgi:outer membrane protein assembly factor BamB
VYVVQKSDGAVVWKSSGFEEIHSSFAVSPDSFYFVTYDGTLYAFDKDNRFEVWNISLDGCTLSSPIVGRNALILPSGKYIYFVEPKAGEVQWKYDFTTGTSILPACVSSTVSISKDIVVFPTAAGYVNSPDPISVGRIYAFAASDLDDPDFGLDITLLLLVVGTVAVATAASVLVYWRRLKTK